MYDENNQKITIKTNPFVDGRIEQVTTVSDWTLREVVNTKEQQFRDALVRLGWTPPPDGFDPDDECEAHDNQHRYDGEDEQ